MFDQTPRDQNERLASPSAEVSEPAESAPALDLLSVVDARLERTSPDRRRSVERPIGNATMDSDGTITLDLRMREGNTRATGVMTYRRGQDLYNQILDHIGGLRPGQIKPVEEFRVRPLPQPLRAPRQVRELEVSPEFVDRVNKVVNQLPQGVRDLLTREGFRVVPQEKMSDEMGERKDEHPRGWPPDATWDHVDGLADPGRKRIVVSEYRREGDDFVKSSDTEGLVRHEVGHALDEALSEFSNSREFKEAYERDVAKIPQADREKMAYYLQDGEAGREEAFAEIFAVLQGGSTRPGYTELILKYFPETVEVVRQKLRELN